MRWTTRTLTSWIISCIVIAGILVAYYLPYYPSVSDRRILADEGEEVVSWLSFLTDGNVSYRFIRPTSVFSLCVRESCGEQDIISASFSWWYIRQTQGQSESHLLLSLTGYEDVTLWWFSSSQKSWRYMSVSTSVWSGKVFVPGSIQTGDGVISFLSTAYVDTRWLGRSVWWFDNPYQKVMIDRRFISQ